MLVILIFNVLMVSRRKVESKGGVARRAKGRELETEKSGIGEIEETRGMVIVGCWVARCVFIFVLEVL